LPGFDPGICKEHEARLKEEQRKLEQKAYALAGHKFDIASWKDVYAPPPLFRSLFLVH
jgi:DNA polymerase I-like protein with 3'-5' exonuclease and polymerase domains